MNKNQRYYAFLALTHNQDFVEEVKKLRKAQSFQNNTFPAEGFSNPADADAFIKTQHQQIMDKKLLVDDHPFWVVEKEIVKLMKKFGLDAADDKLLPKIAKRYFYLNQVVIYRDKFRMTYDRQNQEVHLILKQETNKSDLKNNLDMIFEYKDEMLGVSNRKSEIFYFEDQFDRYPKN